jgi:hypothetical protein
MDVKEVCYFNNTPGTQNFGFNLKKRINFEPKKENLRGSNLEF